MSDLLRGRKSFRGRRRPARARRIHLAIALCSLSSLAGAQPTVPHDRLTNSVDLDEIDSESQTRFVRADALLADGQLQEAISNISAILDASADRMLPSPPSSAARRLGFTHYRPVRDGCHAWLASLSTRSPEALEVYRRGADRLAAAWFRSALDNNDTARLRRISDELFVSTWGDDSLFWQGEIARQRGDYTSARRHWEQIAPGLRHVVAGEDARDSYPSWLVSRSDTTGRNAPNGNPLVSTSWLTYPDSELDVGAIRGRLVLLSILEGNRRRARAELQQLEFSAPLSEGVVAGERGRWADLLGRQLTDSQRWKRSTGRGDWSTFAGSMERAGVERPSFDLLGPPIWSRPLQRLTVAGLTLADRHLRVAEDAAGLLSVHPIVAGDLAIYTCGLHAQDIEGVELQTGTVRFPRRTTTAELEVPHLTGALTVPRLTLTADADVLFALGLDGGGLASRLAAYDLGAEKKSLYSIRLDEPEWKGRWIFEGPPAVDGHWLYVAVRRVEQGRHETHLACFDAARGTLRWRRFVCEAETDPLMVSGYVSNLVTVDQGTVYYNTNLGVVIALRAEDGVPIWAVKYPRTFTGGVDPERNELHQFRDLTPCLVHRDVVVVAPRDCARIFALDAVAGSVLWATPAGAAADAVHLLGVADDTLIASGECLYWFDMATGRMLQRFPGSFHPVPGHARPEPRGYGRGLLAGDSIYFPTRDAILVFKQQLVKTELGVQPHLARRVDLRPRGITGGNLVLQDSVLLIAGSDRVWAFGETQTN